ncbi:MAG: efflux RND transporter permease subunit [Odoribacter splanchnicus]
MLRKLSEARVEPAKVENLFEQLFKGEDAPLIIYLSGESARKIEELSKINAFIDHLNEEMPGLKLNKPAVQERIVVHILPERLALYKVNQNVLLNTLEKNISKVSIGKLNTGNLYIPIVITENEHTIRDILNEVYVSNSDRKYIPVAALTDLSMEYDYKKIFGKKEGVVVPVQVYHTGDSIQEIIKTVRTEAVKANLDPHFGGAYFEGNETFWQMLMIVIVALLMLYFILASQFESLTLPLIVLIEIPIDVAMTLLALWICGISLNLMSMIGIVVMSGIVINDSILKIDTIIRLQQQGFPLLEAIHEGGVRRLKPILMTSLTTIFALIPFLWGDDIGSQLQRPLAVAMISGMTIGTLVSLYWVPLCYYYLVRKKGE